MRVLSVHRARFLAAVWAALVWGGLILPMDLPSSSLPGWLPAWALQGLDELIHWILMLIMAVLLTHAREVGRWAPQWAFLQTAVFGLLTETSQVWAPGRSAELSDLLADLLGAACGALFGGVCLVSFPGPAKE